MSFSRCGLQYSRDNRITNDVHNHPRSKQMSCWIIGAAVKPKQSISSIEVVDQQAKDIIDIRSEEKKLIAEISGQDIVGSDLIKQQIGSGIMDMIGSIESERISVPTSRKEQAGSGVMDKLSNMFPDSDANARDIYPGEHHAIVKLPNGRFGRSNYTGPGTRIVERLKRRGGDPPRVESDAVSQAHDIRYALAQQAADPERAVRNADEIYIKKMKALQRSGLDSSLNIQPAMRTIQAKIKAEDWSLLSRDKFIDTKHSYSQNDSNLLNSKLNELAQQGYGATLAGGNTGGGSVNLHTARRKPIIDLSSNAYFDNQYPKKSGGRLNNNRGLYGAFGYKKRVITPQVGEGYPGPDIAKIDVPNVVSRVGGVGDLAGSGILDASKNYPASRLLKKMRKKIKNKSRNPRYPVYVGSVPHAGALRSARAMSSFLADKLAPLVMTY